jgi:hypothetical protein
MCMRHRRTTVNIRARQHVMRALCYRDAPCKLFFSLSVPHFTFVFKKGGGSSSVLKVKTENENKAYFSFFPSHSFRLYPFKRVRA